MRALIAIAALLVAAPAPAPEINPDVPHNGDHMRVIVADNDVFAAVDNESMRAEKDGSTTAVVLMGHPSDGYAQAGRLSFKCKAQQYRILDLYKVAPHTEPVEIKASAPMPYALVPANSLVAEIFGYVCGTQINGIES